MSCRAIDPPPSLDDRLLPGSRRCPRSEIWINVAERTGIAALRRTTRDEPDYDKLMRGRIEILDQHKLTLHDIQGVIAGMDPLPGAVDFLAWLKSRAQLIILSDTFYQFASPLMRKLEWPCLFCHQLETDAASRITGYRLRIADGKRRAVLALRDLNSYRRRGGRLQCPTPPCSRQANRRQPVPAAAERDRRVPAVPVTTTYGT